MSGQPSYWLVLSGLLVLALSSSLVLLVAVLWLWQRFAERRF